MFRSSSCLRAFALALLLVALSVAEAFAHCFVGPRIGTINPGVIWVGTYFQVGAEAVIPVNLASGTGVGFLGQLHLYLDDMFPSTIGRPLLGGGRSAPPQQLKF
jgi:hypothetical protein